MLNYLKQYCGKNKNNKKRCFFYLILFLSILAIIIAIIPTNIDKINIR